MSFLEIGRFNEAPRRIMGAILDFCKSRFGKTGISIHEIQNVQPEALLPGSKGRERVNYKTKGGRRATSEIIDLSDTYENPIAGQEDPIDSEKLLKEIGQLAEYPHVRYPRRYYK